MLGGIYGAWKLWLDVLLLLLLLLLLSFMWFTVSKYACIIFSLSILKISKILRLKRGVDQSLTVLKLFLCKMSYMSAGKYTFFNCHFLNISFRQHSDIIGWSCRLCY